MKALTIPARFCGPPDSGNGGYCCGIIASPLTGPVEVTLSAPPPLNTHLDLEVADGRVTLSHDGKRIGYGQPAEVDLALPAAPDPAAARAASARFDGFTQHAFPGCFVCGPARRARDGLRLFTGPLDDADAVADVWTPDRSLVDDAGLVRGQFLWAALDCPGYFGLRRPGLVALLGRLTADIRRRPRGGETCTVLGWSLGNDGRKHFAGSAIFDAQGQALAYARAVWIELK